MIIGWIILIVTFLLVASLPIVIFWQNSQGEKEMGKKGV